MSGATSVQGGAEIIILSVCAESIMFSALPAESIILSAPPAESMILSAGSAKQQSNKNCSRKCGNNGGG